MHYHVNFVCSKCGFYEDPDNDEYNMYDITQEDLDYLIDYDDDIFRDAKCIKCGYINKILLKDLR